MNQGASLLYMERIRDYYQALGYGEPYVWASFDDVPFTPLNKPLADSTIAIITTAAPFQADKGDQGPGAPYNGSAKFYAVYSAPIQPEPDLRISHVAYDRDHTSARDQGSYFPLRALATLAAAGEIGAVAPRFYGLPTNRSQATTINVDGVELVSRCLDDQIDAAILVPNCPVCHQSAALAARALEAAGIATILTGCALDIVEHVGVPRLLFNNFPLGNSAGPPGDQAAQLEIARLAVNLLQSATQPRTTQQSPMVWPGNVDWRHDYANAARLSAEQIKQHRAEFDRGKAAAETMRKN